VAGNLITKANGMEKQRTRIKKKKKKKKAKENSGTAKSRKEDNTFDLLIPSMHTTCHPLSLPPSLPHMPHATSQDK